MSTLPQVRAGRIKEGLIASLLAAALAYAALYIIGPFTYMYSLVVPAAKLSKLTSTRILIWVLLENIPDYFLSIFLASVIALYYLKFRSKNDNVPIFVFIALSLLLEAVVLLQTFASGITSIYERYLLFGLVSAKILSVCFAYLTWRMFRPRPGG